MQNYQHNLIFQKSLFFLRKEIYLIVIIIDPSDPCHVYELVAMILYRRISSELSRELPANQLPYQKGTDSVITTDH